MLPLPLIVAVLNAVVACSFRGLAFLAMGVLLLGRTPTACAQTPPGPPAYQPTGLRTLIQVQPHSALVRVRYESHMPGPVQLELRNDQQSVVYRERKRETQFVGNYDLAHLPAGDYSLHVSAAGFHHVEALRLQRTTTALVTAELIRPAAFRISPLSLLPAAGTK